MTFQHEIYVDKSYFVVEYKFSIEFSTDMLKTFFNIVFSLCIKHFGVLMLRIFLSFKHSIQQGFDVFEKMFKTC